VFSEVEYTEDNLLYKEINTPTI